jgi:hypothetical protein
LTPQSVITITNQAIWTRIWGGTEWKLVSSALTPVQIQVSTQASILAHLAHRRRRVQQVRDHEQMSVSTGLHTPSPPPQVGWSQRQRQRQRRPTSSPSTPSSRLISSTQSTGQTKSRHGPSTLALPHSELLSSPPRRLPALSLSAPPTARPRLMLYAPY